LDIGRIVDSNRAAGKVNTVDISVDISCAHDEAIMNHPRSSRFFSRALLAFSSICLLLAPASTARATEARSPAPDVEPAAGQAPEGEGACAFSAAGTFRRGIGLEVNVLWPFVPGIFEARLMVPVLRADRRDWRGEIVTGAYADNASWLVRGDESGKVRNLSAKLGYRQFFVYGLHAEVTANLGWRHESDRPPSGGTVYPRDIDGFQTRLWVMAGYQIELSRALYANARGGVSVNLYRSDPYAYLEKPVVPGGDVNVGIRF
jgi:hypothetical protein